MAKSQVILFSILIFAISSCAFHSGTVNNAQVPQSSKGIVYKDKVYGYASCYYVLGIGGMRSQGLAAEATFNLKSATKLDSGEYLDNFTIDHRRFYFAPFYMHHEVLITADKIKNLDEKKVSYDQEYIRQNQSFTDSESNFFSLNEKVFIQNPNGDGSATEAIIVKHLRNGAKLISLKNNGKIKRRKLNYKYLFKKEANGNITFFLTAKLGDTVTFNQVDFGEYSFKEAVLLGSNHTKILLKDLNSSKNYVADLRTIIIEDSTQAMKENLNTQMSHILNKTKSNQKIIAKTNTGELIYGEFRGIEGESVLMQPDNSDKEIVLELNTIYTLENWLEFSAKRSDKFGFHTNDKVDYFKNNFGESVNVEILGFRYHNVLVKTNDGEILEVPIGKLM